MAKSINNASASCFSINQVLKQIDRRLRRLTEISSEMPQEKPAALDARFDVVSTSLRDCIISLEHYKPNYRLNFLTHWIVVPLGTY